jgi:hypothetical protein
MAIFRKIHTSFWGDSFIQDLTPEQKYFFLYLLTNDKTKQCGIYEITLRQMCYDTGYNEETVKKLLQFFILKGKIRYSESSKEILLLNWLKYNDSTSPKVKSCVNKELEKVKDRVLIEYLYNIDTHSQEEQEKEEEEEEEQEIVLNVIFDDFWDFYDKKVGERKKLEKKWSALTNKDRLDIMDHIPKYKSAQPDKKFRKDPQTYLNNKSWLDEVIPSKKTETPQNRPKTAYELKLEAARKSFKNIEYDNNSI